MLILVVLVVLGNVAIAVRNVHEVESVIKLLLWHRDLRCEEPSDRSRANRQKQCHNDAEYLDLGLLLDCSIGFVCWEYDVKLCHILKVVVTGSDCNDADDCSQETRNSVQKVHTASVVNGQSFLAHRIEFQEAYR